ncbi:MAG: 4Fe-4S binding protein, partial [Dissulfurispiraceae bacterium]
MSTPSLIKQALRIVLRYDEDAKLNLFEVFPGLKHFFIHRRNLAYIRTFGDLFFTALIILGLFGPQDPQRNVSLFILWGIWWTGVVMSWFYTGRLWCGFCPFPGIGRFFQRVGLSLNLEVPNIFKKYCVYLAVILLAVIIWTEEVTNLKSWPAGTAYLLISILLGATILGVIFKGQAWCRHVCPLGKMIGSASTLSLTEFRPDVSKCKTCETFACRRGSDRTPGCPVYLGAINVRNNINCLVCGHCISLCDSDSPRINLRNPFTEL